MPRNTCYLTESNARNLLGNNIIWTGKVDGKLKRRIRSTIINPKHPYYGKEITQYIEKIHIDGKETYVKKKNSTEKLYLYTYTITG